MNRDEYILMHKHNWSHVLEIIHFMFEGYTNGTWGRV